MNAVTPPPVPVRNSHLAGLPTASFLNRSTSSKSSTGFTEYDPRTMTTLSATTNTLNLPFPRQTSAEFFKNSSSTPSPSSAPTSPFEMIGPSVPTWPNPASYSFSQATRKSPLVQSTLKKGVGAGGGGNLICFELALGDRLAARLDGETTLDSIREASGVISTELTQGEDEGPKKLISTGSASAVQKARQLLDAKLSQTPIRTIVGIKLDPSNSSSFTFIPSIGPHISRLQPLSSSTYRLVSSVLPPTSLLSRPRLGSFPSTTSVISEFSLPPSQSHSPEQATTPTLVTPSSESSKNDDKFFSPSPGHTRESTVTVPPPSVVPQIGDFDELRDDYIRTMVDELEASVKRRSLVRVKMDFGTQEWRRDGVKNAEDEFVRDRWSIEEIEKWSTDNSKNSDCPVSPTFSTSLSSPTVDKFLSTLKSTDSSFEKKSEISQARIFHLDKSRASFGCAIAECRGQELRELPRGCTASGTLVLRKCSTLPSKPFSLSIISPTSASNRQVDGTDLRLKILADKAATSPSLDLSAAMQSATWEVDDLGDFRVKIDLKEERFGETEIRWNSRERWENHDETLRVTLSENRYSDSSKHNHSIEISSPKLNRILANYALDQAQGKKVVCTMGCGAGFYLFGYDQGIANALTQSPDFQSMLSKIDKSDTALGAVLGTFVLGAFVGCLGASVVGNRVGRRPFLIFASLFTLIGAAGQAGAVDLRMFITFRIINGIAVGILTSIVPSFVAEISKPEIRGLMMSLELVIASTGLATSFWVAYGFAKVEGPLGWRIPLALQGCFVLITIVCLLFMPESPRWLMEAGRVEEGRRVLERLHGTDFANAAKEEILQAIAIERAAEETAPKGYFACFHGNDQCFRYRTLCAIGVNIAQQATGINMATYYAGVIFIQGVGLKPDDASLALGGLGLTGLLSCIIGCFVFMERLGRVKLMMLGAGFLCLGQILLAAGVAQSAILAASGLYLFLTVFNGRSPFSRDFAFVYSAEITPLAIRTRAATLGISVQYLINFFVVITTPIGIANLGFKYYIIYAVFNALIIPLCWYFLPEVGNLSLEQVDQLFANGKVQMRRTTKLSLRETAEIRAGPEEKEISESVKSVEAV
ncbi:hypothetical protein JCM5350_006247 [Sporobolomyces pararoseus]